MELSKEIFTDSQLKKLNQSPFPGFIPPMLATLTEDYFDDPKWIYERKLDGIRCEVVIQNGKIILYSRNHNDISKDYPSIVEALKKQKQENIILDGELVAFRGNKTSFAFLQGRFLKNSEEKPVKIYLYLFDILYVDDFSLKNLSLRERKKILQKTVIWEDPLRFTSHRNKNGIAYLKQSCAKDWEGIIAKNGMSNYTQGRSKNWLKFKCSQEQELVIGGFTKPQGARKGFGALLVGFYKNDKLYYAGKVGTGFDDAFLEEWRNNFDNIITEESPFVNFSDTKKGTNIWVVPKYVGQFGFTEWTTTNKLRHPRFLGMRTDKDAKQVIKEIPKKIQ